MKTCILVIVKNEELYLDMFIKYHLDLGINHIFIFEDVNSISHKKITEKYSRVTLNPIELLYKDTEIKRNQHEYLRRALEYIQKNYDYDFCFVIDIDEYITLKENSSLGEVLEKYSKMDCLVLQWMNYGANGHIYQPEYNKPLEAVYTKKAGMSVNDSQVITTKMCVNLKTWNRKFWCNNHICNEKCKWCKPGFIHDRKTPVYGEIFLRHYITKSFEEYVNKVYIRGLFSKWHRNYEDFFSLNPDMLDRKEELIKIGEKLKMDRVKS